MPDAQSGGAGTGSADNRVVRSFRQGPLRKRPRGGQRGSHAVAVNLGIAPVRGEVVDKNVPVSPDVHAGNV